MIARHVTSSSPPVQIVGGVNDGNTITRTHVVVERAFGPGASLRVGTADDPEAVFESSSVDLEREDQYESRIMYRVRKNESIRLCSEVPPSSDGHAIVYVEVS